MLAKVASSSGFLLGRLVLGNKRVWGALALGP